MSVKKWEAGEEGGFGLLEIRPFSSITVFCESRRDERRRRFGG